MKIHLELEHVQGGPKKASLIIFATIFGMYTL